MNILKQILVVICLVIIFFYGLYYIVMPVPVIGNFVKNEVNKIQIDEIGMTIIYFLLVLTPLVVLEIQNRSSSSRDEFVVKGDGGNISITYDAVSRYVKNVLYGIESVEAVKTTLAQSKKGIIVNIAVKIKATKTLGEIDKQIRKRIKDGLSVVLGLENIGEINVSFKEIGYKKKTYDEIVQERAVMPADIFKVPEETKTEKSEDK